MLRAFTLMTLVLGWLAPAASAEAGVPKEAVGCYIPVPGGWQIHISNDPAAPRLPAGETIGVVLDDARLHRRPLYPPSDRRLIWNEDELAARQRTPFRPLILAANEPRLLIDLDSAGGLSGHLFLGLTVAKGPSKWLHQFDDLDVRYVDGQMLYVVRDRDFPGVVVRLELAPLDASVGLVLKINVEGASPDTSLVWMFGGASGYSTNYDHDAKPFRYSADQCAENTVRWDQGRFTLLRGGAMVLRGGSSSPEGVGFGDPAKVLESPAALCESAQWCAAGPAAEATNRVAVQRVPLAGKEASAWLVIGRGGQIESFLADPAESQRLALARQHAITSRIEVHTPDAYLNQAMPMMALATEGIWGDTAILHGAWSWRQTYLGWRGHYGALCYGWDDRIRHSLQQHSTLGLIREGADQGALSCMLESLGVFYNMDEVFLDQVRQYWDYTGDRELMRQIFPVLRGIVQWEDRRLRPGGGPLYESSLNTWISDSHWYIGGQCTTASAYMLGAHRFLAELAESLGEDPQPYRQQAEAIRRAMHTTLWQPRKGIFAEYLDTLGTRQLHPEPELPTLYHSAEFGAVEPREIYQMLDWADHNLRNQATPGGGRAWWSSNWAPNNGRSYTHSTYEMAYAEQFNLALMNHLVGRGEVAYSLLRSGLCGIYNGPTPGGLACHMFSDGRQRANNEFADAISMWGRAVVEGLFGIRPKRSQGVVELSPQFPAAWPEASIKTPHFSYQWRRDGGRMSLDWQSPVQTAVRLRLPIQAQEIEQVTVDGKAVAYEVEPGVGLSWLVFQTPSGMKGSVSVAWTPAKISSPPTLVWKEGDRAGLALADYAASECYDPQGVLRDAHTAGGQWQGEVAGEPGSRLVLLKSAATACPYWLPLTVAIEPREPVVAKRWSPPAVQAGDLAPWTLVDLKALYNASLTEVLPRVAKASQPPAPPALGVNHSYWKDHLTSRVPPGHPSDAAWRKKIGPEQIGWTHDRIPFRSAQQGDNIAVVTLAGGFPSKVDVPVNAGGQTLYLMLSGMTFPAQSHVVNLRVTLAYADGSSQVVDLVNPTGIGDCWSTWCGRFHDTAANGFENLGGRTGPAGSAAAGDLTQPIALDTEAHLLAIPLRPGQVLQSFTLEARANDAIFGLMGASVLK